MPRSRYAIEGRYIALNEVADLFHTSTADEPLPLQGRREAYDSHRHYFEY